MEANSQAMSELKNREAAEKHRIDTEIAAAKANAAKLEGKTVKLTAKAGANGKLFGSVTSKDVAALVSNQFGIQLDKRKVVVEDIKAFGTYPVEVKLYNGISASMFVMVGE
jgi:large subunit ribosomal protein L9